MKTANNFHKEFSAIQTATFDARSSLFITDQFAAWVKNFEWLMCLQMPFEPSKSVQPSETWLDERLSILPTRQHGDRDYYNVVPFIEYWEGTDFIRTIHLFLARRSDLDRSRFLKNIFDSWHDITIADYTAPRTRGFQIIGFNKDFPETTHNTFLEAMELSNGNIDLSRTVLQYKVK